MKYEKDKLYICKNCGYHQGLCWDGEMKKCSACGKFKWRDFDDILC